MISASLKSWVLKTINLLNVQKLLHQIVMPITAISMLVLNQNANFSKKARGTITFTCDQGSLIAAAIDETIQTREGVTLWLQGTGVDEDGDVVTVMNFEWTIKVKNP